jgi:DNA replicative helicase MCM subunit Mcm2 (Cdc46/Mcm family)
MSEIDLDDVSQKQILLFKIVKKQDEPSNSSILESEDTDNIWGSINSVSNAMRKLESQKLVKSSKPDSEKIYELTGKGSEILDQHFKIQRQKVEDKQDSLTYSEMADEFQEYFDEVDEAKESLVLAGKGREFVELDYSQLEKHNVDLADRLWEKPDLVLKACHEAVTESTMVDKGKEIRITAVPDYIVKPTSQLSSKSIDSLVAIEGVIKNVSGAMSARTDAVFECSDCGDRYQKEQEPGGKLKSPYKCECGCRKFEPLEENWETVRTVTLKEKPDQSSGEKMICIVQGRLAEDVEKTLEAVGSAVTIVGKMEAEEPTRNSKFYPNRIRVNNIQLEDDKWDSVEITEQDIENFQEISERDDTREIIVKSLANEEIAVTGLLKEAFIKWLLGRSEGENNLHVLCVGDPSTGKSKLAKIVHSKFPRVMKSVGQGASEVGLTGAVVKNDMTGEWTAEAGALPMADGGFHITDEIDKLDPDHYSAFNEALSDGEVSLSKANIQANMSADVAEFSIGNPEAERSFHSETPKYKQIPITERDLKSRYGLKLAVEYGTDPEDERKKTRKISSKKYPELELEDEQEFCLDEETLVKYIVYAQDISPQMTKKAYQKLENTYIKLFEESSSNSNRTIDVRKYEALDNLSRAYARLHLSEEITVEHVERAIDFFKECYASLDIHFGETSIDDMEESEASELDRVRDIGEQLMGDRRDGTAKIESIVEETDLSESKVEEHVKNLQKEEWFEPEPGKVQKL